MIFLLQHRFNFTFLREFYNEKYNVLRIGEVCKQKNISYLGIVYTAAKYLPPIYLPDIAKVQYTFRQKLISNEAAALLLRHRLDK